MRGKPLTKQVAVENLEIGNPIEIIGHYVKYLGRVHVQVVAKMHN